MVLKHKIVIWIALLLGVTACNSDEPVSHSGNGEQSVFYINLKAANGGLAGGSLNTNAEDRVTEVRLLIFDSANGNVLYNTKHPVADFIGGTNKAIAVTAGERDFFFVANETAVAGISDVLNRVTHREQLYVEDALRKIPYNSAFAPDMTTSEGRFLMTTEYRNKTIAQGGTETNPLPFNSGDPNGTVYLLRTLAKVEVTMKEAVVREAGNDRFVNFAAGFRVADMHLNAVTQYYTLFAQYKYYTDFYPPVGTNVTSTANFWSLANNEIPYEASMGTNPRDFKYTLYVPEHLRSAANDDVSALPAVPGAAELQVATATTSASPQIRNTRYAIDHGTFNRPGDAYWLPDAVKNKFSRYSVLRNTNYKLTASAQDVIQVHFELAPWSLVKKYLYMGTEYNVEISDIAFTGNEIQVTVVNSMPHILQPHSVTFEIPAGAPVEFPAGAPAPFVSTAQFETSTFTLRRTGPIDPQVGFLILKYNGTAIKTFGKTN